MTGLKVGDKVIHIGSAYWTGVDDNHGFTHQNYWIRDGEEGTITGFSCEHPYVRFGKRHVYVGVNKVQLASPRLTPWWKRTTRKLQL